MDFRFFTNTGLETRSRRRVVHAGKDAGIDEVDKTGLKRKITDSASNRPNKITKDSACHQLKAETNKAAAKKNSKIIKRKTSSSENEIPPPAVNGSKADTRELTDDEESPNKKRKQSESGEGQCTDNSEDMDVQVEDEEGDEDMDEEEVEEDSYPQPDDRKNKGHTYDYLSQWQAMNREKSGMVSKEDAGGQGSLHCSIYRHTDQVGTAAPQRQSAHQSGADVRLHASHTEALTRPRIKPSIYVTTESLKGIAMPANHMQTNSYRHSAVPLSSQYQKSRLALSSEGDGKSKKGWSSLLCFGLILLSLAVLLFVVVYLFPVQIYLPNLPLPTTILHGDTETKSEFERQFVKLESQFPRQRADFWKRSEIHLSRRLQADEHTEPVSVILTSGRRAEKTLRCVALHVASALSSALNASVVQIDGAGKASLDSDQVKLDIDGELTGAFAGHRGVAVIHRFEELPPGSTLIFYKYCDHENAAFKDAFLIFTVLLPVDDLAPELDFKVAEEMVQDYVADRLLSSAQPAAFDRLDVDKLSGLWSRISHLILPVVPEGETEQNGCQL